MCPEPVAKRGGRKNEVPVAAPLPRGRAHTLGLRQQPIGSGPTYPPSKPGQSEWASRYAAITWAGIRPLARTCIPCSLAQARTASDCPRGAVLAATPAGACLRGAPARPWPGALRAAFLTEALLPVGFGPGDPMAAALVAEARLAAAFLSPFIGRPFLNRASF